MRRRKNFGVLVLAAAILIGGNAPFTAREVRAENSAEAVQEKSVLDKIVVKIDKENNVVIETKGIQKSELVKIQVKVGNGNFSDFVRDAVHQEKIKEEVKYNKDTVKDMIIFKYQEKERCINFSSQNPIDESRIQESGDKTLVTIAEQGGEYGLQGSLDWSDIENSQFSTGFIRGEDKRTFKIRLKAKKNDNNSFVFASDTISFPVDRLDNLKEIVSRVEFEATSENNGLLKNVVEGIQYSLNGGGRWYDVSKSIKDSTHNIPSGVQTTPGIWVRYYDNDKAKKHIVVIGTDLNPYRNLIKEHKGKITGIPEGFQVKKSSAGQWTDVVGGVYIAPEITTYSFRMGPKGNRLASGIVENITVREIDPSVHDENKQLGQNNPGQAGEQNGGSAGGGHVGGGGNAGGGFIGGGAVAVQPEKKEEKKEARAEEKKAEEKAQKEMKAEKDVQETKEVQIRKEAKASEDGKNLRASVTAEDFANKREAVITVSSGEESFTVKADKLDLTPGKTLKVFEEKNGKLLLVNSKKYQVGEEGLDLSLKAGKAYVAVNEAVAKKIEKKILSSLKLRKKNLIVKAGTKGKFTFAKGFHKGNIKKVDYKYNKAKLSVTKSGAIKVKTVGKTGVLTIKVTLKNNMTKILKLKVSGK